MGVFFLIIGASIDLGMAFYNVSAAQESVSAAAKALSALPTASCEHLEQLCGAEVARNCSDNSRCCLEQPVLCKCYAQAAKAIAEKRMQELAVGPATLNLDGIEWDTLSESHSGRSISSLLIKGKLKTNCFFCRVVTPHSEADISAIAAIVLPWEC